ncbi:MULTISPECIES: ParB/RepB/Spo0J family partition protein [Paraburkholderia]|uniref:ParB/RepB/Spo0J family partition protein n=1 Tax=Paraburkholderia TaxID=1822464 RepID=UPI00225777F0|nr:MULTISPECIES: ParB/RepB/Spo0J family partition protein [Paraburkholderia]MCX4176627.1 ParB N-terminal domain-containing protein [Paraburkholderia madseniana]MDQ6464619.1 ParB N-terminal domain-containing protein [Paraburkholderia madseniana]
MTVARFALLLSRDDELRGTAAASVGGRRLRKTTHAGTSESRGPAVPLHLNPFLKGIAMETVRQNDAVQNAQANESQGHPQRLITDEADFTLIPLNRLVKSPFNQRKKERPQADVVSLAVNIRGLKRLLQNLVVHPMKKVAKKAQTYGVDAGETRRLALNWLAEQGDIPDDYPVRCQIISVADAILASASENDVRNPAHPADQCHAYLALVEEGRSAEHIAEIFNINPKTVARRLKLANVSPRLCELWRNDEMELSQIQALALSDDHEAQERVWFSAQAQWQRQPHELRKVITQDEINASNSPIARFVGLEMFEKAGGKVRRDLFANESEGWFTDMALMSSLALQKLEEEAAPIRAEGWKWVEVRTDFPHEARSEFSQISPASLPFSDEQQAEFQTLEAHMDEIEKLQAADNVTDEEFNKLEEELEQLQTRYSQIEDAGMGYAPEVKAHAGVVVFLTRNGVGVTVGLVRADDEPALRTVIEESGHSEEAEHLTRTASAGISHSQPAKEKSAHSEKLLLNLTAHRTAAVQCELAMNPHVALATIVHKLALDFVYRTHEEAISAVQVSCRDATHEIERSAPGIKKEARYETLRLTFIASRIAMPKDPNALFGWLLEQSQAALLNILAVCTAISLNGVSKTEGPNAINAIAAALDVNMSAYWQPTRESYLDHISKDRIVAIVGEAVSPDEGKRLAKMKKGEAAETAEKLLEGKNWLPDFMVAAEAKQIRYYATRDDDTDEDDQTPDDEGSGVVSDEASTPETPDQGGAVEVQATAELGAWHFPKASDFACETAEAETQSASVAQPVNAVNAPLSPASAWPFPAPNPAAFISLPKAA